MSIYIGYGYNVVIVQTGQRSLVRFTGALIADGGRKLLLDGNRGAASDGGNLYSVSIVMI